MRKHLYILLVLVAIVSAYMVACKNKPTAMAEFIEEPTAPTTDNNIPESSAVASIPDSATFKDYTGYSFMSKKYYISSDNVSGTFQYTIEIKQWGYGNSATVAEFKGYENGAEFTRTYVGTSRLGNHKFALVKATGGGNGADRADIEFNAKYKQAHFKPSDYNFTIVLGCTNYTQP